MNFLKPLLPHFNIAITMPILVPSSFLYFQLKFQGQTKVKFKGQTWSPSKPSKKWSNQTKKNCDKRYFSTSAYLQSYNYIYSLDTCCILCNWHRLRRLWCNSCRGCIIKGCVNRESILPSKAGIRLHQHIHCQPSPTLSPATQWL